MIKAICEILFMLSYVFLCLFCAKTYLTRVRELEEKVHSLTEKVNSLTKQIKQIRSTIWIGDDGK